MMLAVDHSVARKTAGIPVYADMTGRTSREVSGTTPTANGIYSFGARLAIISFSRCICQPVGRYIPAGLCARSGNTSADARYLLNPHVSEFQGRRCAARYSQLLLRSPFLAASFPTTCRHRQRSQQRRLQLPNLLTNYPSEVPHGRYR